MKVLIVDDHADFSVLLKTLLDARIYVDLTSVLSGKLALESLRVDNFDLMVCDYDMPEMNGHEVFQAMQREGLSCPFLLYTSEILSALPKFEGPGFLGIVDKIEIEKLFGHIKQVYENTR